MNQKAIMLMQQEEEGMQKAGAYDLAVDEIGRDFMEEKHERDTEYADMRNAPSEHYQNGDMIF